MRYLALIAILLSTVAYADDSKPADAPTVAAAPIQPEPAKAAPVPVQPSLWVLMDLDASDINNLQTCAGELPKKVADPFIERMKARLKVVK